MLSAITGTIEELKAEDKEKESLPSPSASPSSAAISNLPGAPLMSLRWVSQPCIF